MRGSKNFNEEMKSFFQAQDGAYTTFTTEELRKRSFNVKAKIRDLLIAYLGEENIPRANTTPNQSIRFNICDKARIWVTGFWDIPCKFSKPNSREMSIYFLSDHIERLNAVSGDYWYVYFRENIPEPFVGVLSKQLWTDLFEQDDNNADDTQLSYNCPVAKLSITEVSVPKAHHTTSTGKEKTTHTLSPDQAANREKNNKIKGNRAEDIALEIEKRRIVGAGRPDLVPKIIPVARNTDGLGYDIRSVDVLDDGTVKEIFIEVKGTSGDVDTPFHVSKRELQKSQQLKEAYYLYRIFNIRDSSSDVKFYKVNGSLDETFSLTPESYWAENK